jgi:hypothetical protein
MIEVTSGKARHILTISSLALVMVFISPMGMDAQAQNPCPVEVMGDYNGDGVVTSADIINMICVVYKGCPRDCVTLASADVNCSGYTSAADILMLVDYVFRSVPYPCDVCEAFYSGERSCP